MSTNLLTSTGGILNERRRGEEVIVRQIKTAGGIIRHSVERTRVVKDRRGEQSHTVHLIPDAKKICHNRVNGRSFPEAPADCGGVVAACLGCVTGMARAGKGEAKLLQQQRCQFQV